MIRAALARLAGLQWGNTQELIRAALAALDGTAASLGAAEGVYLRDLRKGQQGLIRLVREIAELAASQAGKQVHITAKQVEVLSAGQSPPGHLALQPSLVSQGRSPRSGSSAQRETLDWQPRKTLWASPKTTFSELPPGEGVVFARLSADNISMNARPIRAHRGLSTYHISPQGENPVDLGPLLPVGDEGSKDRAFSDHAFDKYHYQKHKLHWTLTSSLEAQK